MYEDNLAEFLNYCDEEEDLCAICLCKLPDVRVINNCCQQCEDSLVAELEDY